MTVPGSTLRWPLSLIAILGLVLLTVVMMPPKSAYANTFVVDTILDNPALTACTGEAADCSLPGAITRANMNADLDSITFALGGGTPIIDLTADLPVITQPVNIDGNTPATRVQVNWNGGGLGFHVGFNVDASSAVLANLVVTRFPQIGIELDGNNNTVYGSYVGVGPDGASDQGNGTGIYITGDNNVVDAPTLAFTNVISGNGVGVKLFETATNNRIEGSYIGTNATGTASRPNDTDGIQVLGAAGNFIGSAASATGRNWISGNGGIGVKISGSGASDNVVAGNVIGLGASSADLGNGSDGIQIIDDAHENQVFRNAISGNNASGVAIIGEDAFGNVVRFNQIGLSLDGTIDRGNSVDGVFLDGRNNTIGGTQPLDYNTISGNGDSGIHLYSSWAHHNTVLHNAIGTTISGEPSITNVQNSDDGVYISDGAHDNTIGGATANSRNLISGNGGDGIDIGPGSPGNKVLGNYIGTDRDGQQPLQNNGNGVLVASESTTIGGNAVTGVAPGNVIAANGGSGITVAAGTGPFINILGNRIGVGTDGGALGNGEHGVAFLGGYKSEIGTPASNDGNEIANNFGDGVFVDTPATVSIRGNSIYDNIGLGIDLAPNGVNENDTGDGDSGANGRINFPVVMTAEAGSLHVTGTLDTSDALSPFQVDFYTQETCDPLGNGEGLKYQGSAEITNVGPAAAAFDVTLPVSVSPGDFVTATTTFTSLFNTDHFTSEFSDCRVIVAGPSPTSSTPSPTPTATPAGSATPTATPAPGGVRGDADCDNDSDTLDALQAAKFFASLPTAPCIARADVNCNGNVQLDDILAIIRDDAHLPVPTPGPGCQAIGAPIV